MTKKGKIIVIFACVVCLLLGVIAGIIVANIKIYDMSYKEPDYNSNTSFIKVEQDGTNFNLPSTKDSYTSNATTIVSNNSDLKGVYSVNERRLIIDTIYTKITPISLNTEENSNLFKCINEKGVITIFDDKGNNTNLTSEVEEKTYSQKTAKMIEHKESKDKVRVTIDSDFEKIDIEIKDIEYTSIDNYNKTKSNGTIWDKLLSTNNENFEIWTITTKDNVKFTNLYEIDDNERKLVQTLDLSEGITLDKHNLSMYITTKGKPLFYSLKKTSLDGELISVELNVLDKNFNKKGSCEIHVDTIHQARNAFRVGNNVYFQVIKTSNEDNYDYYTQSSTNVDNITYYQYETWKLDLTNANLSKTNFNYVILKSVLTNNKIGELLVATIDDGKLSTAKTLIVNEKLQSKEIDYLFSNITKLSSSRFLATYEETIEKDGSTSYKKIAYIIDKGYKIVTTIGEYSNIFTTIDSIIVTNTDTTYICNIDGVIIKKYNSNDIIDIHHERYYLVREISTDKDGVESANYYLEQCGLRHDSPILTSNIPAENNAPIFTTYGDYKAISLYNTNNYSIIIKIIEEKTSTFTYEIYNIENTLLARLNGISSGNFELIEVYSEGNFTIVSINNQLYIVNK